MPQALQALLSLDIEGMYEQLAPAARRDFWHSILERITIEHYEKGFNKPKEFGIYFRT